MNVKASELRIGNWVLLPTGGYHKINAQSIVAQAQHEAANADGYNPIPLTEEILLKCGFKSYCSENMRHDKLLKLEAYKHPMKEGYGMVLTGLYTLPHIKYLHQLQNLYFALTGNELTIEL